MTRPSGGRPRPLRVLYISPQAELGGAERVTLDLIALHNRSAVEPSICFLRDGPLVLHCRETLGVPTHLVPAPSAKRYFAGRQTVRTLSELVTSSGTDLVHSVMAWGHLFGGRASRRAGKPAVWFQHAGADWSSRIEVWAALIKSAGIIANSEFTAVRQRKVNPRGVPITVVHPGTRFPEEPYEARRIRARLAMGIGDDEFAVGIAARLQPWKGQDVAIRAAASLLHARRNARLFVIGDALFGLDKTYAASLPGLAKELAISDRVTMTGFRPDVLDVLAGLDVALVASRTPESFGLGLIEAMASRTALIAVDSGAAREIVNPGIDGLLTPPGDHEALATAMLAMCDDTERRQQLAEAGERTARERFGADLMTRRVEALYQKICPR